MKPCGCGTWDLTSFCAMPSFMRSLYLYPRTRPRTMRSSASMFPAQVILSSARASRCSWNTSKNALARRLLPVSVAWRNCRLLRATAYTLSVRPASQARANRRVRSAPKLNPHAALRATKLFPSERSKRNVILKMRACYVINSNVAAAAPTRGSMVCVLRKFLN